MISPKKWIMSQKYGRQGALQVNPLKAKGPQIQPVKALAGGLLNPLIRTALKTKGYRSFSQKINKYVKDLVAKHKKDPGIAKLEGKRLKIGAIKTGLDKSRKDMSKNLFVRKHYFGASSQARGYQKKLKDITKTYMHKRANPKIRTHLAGGLLTKGIKFGYKAAKRKYPELARWLSTSQKAKKVSLPGSGTKMSVKDIQKLALAETTQNKIRQLARIKWGKARRSLKQSSLPSSNLYWKGFKRRTLTRLEPLKKDVAKLEAYKTKLEGKWSTKHATGGLIIGKNIDRSLL